jgi:N-acetylmuramate 1-kinase
MEVVAPRPQEILAFARSITGGAGTEQLLLAGQASTRKYHRVKTAGTPPSCVVMELPAEDRASVEATYPFLNVQRFLARGGYPVPKVHRVALSSGMIGLEDLGDQTLELALIANDRAEATVRDLYGKAIRLIGSLQLLGKSPDTACVAFGRSFDFKLLRWELEHFREWLLIEDRRAKLSDSEKEVIETSFDRIAQELASQPPVLVHRDFQSRNLMVVPGSQGSELRVIDFQDALLGPRVYDLVALLRDSYVELSGNQITEFIKYFCTRGGFDYPATRRLFMLQTVQRKLKDAGRFVFIDRKRGNPGFLPCIPLSLNYVSEAFSELPEFSDLCAVLSRYVDELRS